MGQYGIKHPNEYTYEDYKCDVEVNGKQVSFDVVSGAVNVGKWFRDSLYQLVEEVMCKNDVRRFLKGVDYTFEKDGLFYLWRCRPHTSTFVMPSVIPMEVV